MASSNVKIVNEYLSLMDHYRENVVKKSVSTQTGHRESMEFQISLSENKRARIFYSKSYKEYVLSFNYTNCKKFIVSKSMWKIFRIHFNRIDSILTKT